MSGLVTNTDSPHLGGNAASGDPATYCPSVWDYIIARFCIESVLDLGSGVGNASFYFHKKGLKVVAVEGLVENIERSLYPAIQHDLTHGPIHTKVDLVHCQEVVEHIEEKYLENIIASLTNGKIILMTHALPGQTGHHHVNEQPPSYWIEHLSRHNCTVLVEDSNRIRNLAGQDRAVFMAATGLVLVNNGRL